MAELYPNSTLANRAVYIPGEVATLTIRIKNTGNLGVASFYRLQIHEASAIGRGDLVGFREGQTSHISPGQVYSLTYNHKCTEKTNLRRDVVIWLWHDKLDGILLATTSWPDAFSVEKLATKLQIMDLTLS